MDKLSIKLALGKALIEETATIIEETGTVIASVKELVDELDNERRKVMYYAAHLIKVDPVAFDALSAATLLGEVEPTLAAAHGFVMSLNANKKALEQAASSSKARGTNA